MDIIRQTNLAPQEKFVIVPAFIQTAGKAAESIQVQLPLEAGHFALLEVLGHDVVDEFLGFVNHKTAAVGLPRNNAVVSIALNGVEHGMQLDGEWNDDASFGLVLDAGGIDYWISRVIVIIVLDDDLAVDAMSTAVDLIC